MEREEYDRRFKREPIDILQEFSEDLQTESVTVDGTTVAPLRINVINSTSQDRYTKHMESLLEHEEVVGVTADGKKLVRKVGGADYANNGPWIEAMRRIGRLKRR